MVWFPSPPPHTPPTAFQQITEEQPDVVQTAETQSQSFLQMCSLYLFPSLIQKQQNLHDRDQPVSSSSRHTVMRLHGNKDVIPSTPRTAPASSSHIQWMKAPQGGTCKQSGSALNHKLKGKLIKNDDRRTHQNEAFTVIIYTLVFSNEEFYRILHRFFYRCLFS